MEQIKEFITKHVKYIAGAAVILVLGVLLAVSTTANKKVEEKPKEEEKKAEEENKEEEEEDPAELVSNELEKDAYPEVNALVEKYYTNMASGKVDEVKKVVNELPDYVENQISHKKDAIEKYENIACYTKKGPEENSYIVLAYNEAKYNDIETVAPSLDSMYVAPDKDGTLQIVLGDLDDDILSYVSSVASEDDVKELQEEVLTKYNSALDSDEDLKALIEKLLVASGKMTEEEQKKAEEDAKKKKAEEEKKAAEDKKKAEEEKKAKEDKKKEEEKKAKDDKKKEEEKKAKDDKKEKTDEEKKAAEEEKATKAAQGAPGRFVTLSDTVNIRASFNESAKKVYTAAPGEVLRVEMDYAEGWSKVTVYHNGKVGYVKTMYLK